MEVVYSRISDHHKSLFSSNFANKVGFKTAGSVIPAQTLQQCKVEKKVKSCFYSQTFPSLFHSSKQFSVSPFSYLNIIYQNQTHSQTPQNMQGNESWIKLLSFQPEPGKWLEIFKTYWKLFGSPEFQFSNVRGWPVDIHTNLQMKSKYWINAFKAKNFLPYKWSSHITHAFKAEIIIVAHLPSSPWSVPLLQKCSLPIPNPVMCSSSILCSSSLLMLARCMLWYLQNCSALNQLA